MAVKSFVIVPERLPLDFHIVQSANSSSSADTCMTRDPGFADADLPPRGARHRRGHGSTITALDGDATQRPNLAEIRLAGTRAIGSPHSTEPFDPSLLTRLFFYRGRWVRLARTTAAQANE